MRTVTSFVVALAAILAAIPALAEPVELTIDPVHSSIVFSISHNNGAGKVYGRFNGFTGTISADPADIESSSVEVKVDSKTVDTAVAKRDDHLRTPDFFNVEQFPELTFKSTAVRKARVRANSYELDGELTLLGVTKPLTGIKFEQLATTTGKDGTPITGFTAEFTVKRSDFGMNYGLPGTGDEVEVLLAFECKGPTPPAPATTEAPKA
jgi:polyisoprenoid-binding protein YceI